MRPTALIRKMMELEILEEKIAQQMRTLKQQLQQQNISILERNHRVLDIRIQYRWNGRIHEAVFMKAMLDAEVQGRCKEWLGEERQ